ncbi:MAG: indolepyruvate ferredoxin oxidoreductase, partial [Ramlibacter sp.]|nr:indolepyruvate ferredoxin oxidoreductase [Ramlibacter sp.]
ELRAVLELRVPELIAFQDEDYARRYVRQVAAVLRAESDLPGSPCALALAVARNLYKLMAFKDEYEVARLLLDDAEKARLARTFGDRPRVTWHLHPTFLRSLGFRQKVKLGPWFAPALKLLRAAKVIRGTALDVFARTEVRRLERRLLAHYEAVVQQLATRLTVGSHDNAVRIAALPDMVRGYEDVKLRNARGYASEINRETAALGLQLPLAVA